jgi:hypothetical protein
MFWVEIAGVVHVFSNHFDTVAEAYNCAETIHRRTGMPVRLRSAPPVGLVVEDHDELIPIAGPPSGHQQSFSFVWAALHSQH